MAREGFGAHYRAEQWLRTVEGVGRNDTVVALVPNDELAEWEETVYTSGFYSIDIGSIQDGGDPGLEWHEPKPVTSPEQMP